MKDYKRHSYIQIAVYELEHEDSNMEIVISTLAGQLHMKYRKLADAIYHYTAQEKRSTEELVKFIEGLK
jgi:hypothetical protein